MAFSATTHTMGPVPRDRFLRWATHRGRTSGRLLVIDADGMGQSRQAWLRLEYDCTASGSVISWADGTREPLEQIKPNDYLLERGKYRMPHPRTRLAPCAN